MLLTMIPMGMITASAEGADYSIASVDDWNTLAAQNLDFDGKTVALTADIDATAAKLKTLSPDFKGTFEGNGKKISNALVDGKALIATTITGSATIQNLLLENVDVNAAVGYAGLLISSINSNGTITIKKVSADVACSVAGASDTGGIIGYMVLADAAAKVDISYVLIEAIVTSTNNGYAGGIVGNDKSTAGVMNISQTVTLCNVSLADDNTAGKANGLIGYSYGIGTKNQYTINLSSIVIGGTMKNYTVMWMWNGTINYSALYFVDGVNEAVFGASAYASWLNGVRTKGLGPNQDRSNITIESLAAREAIMDDDPPASFRMELPKVVAQATDVITMDGGFLYKIGRPEGIPTLDLSNYDTETTFTIKNLADWELIAKSDKDFAGKKVVLDADLDGWDEGISTLAANFAGHFDGQGHTIKSVVVSDGGLIATTINASADVIIENLNVDRVTVNYTEGNAGAIVGTLVATDANVTIQKVTVKNAVVQSGGTTGGLIGQLNVKAATKPVTVNIKQVYVAGIVESTVAQKQAGGLIGADSSNGTSKTNTVTMNISDSVVNCTVTAISYANGLMGYYGGGNNSNGGGVLANADNWAYLNLTNLAVSGGRDFMLLWMNNGVVNASNIYLANFGAKVFGASAYGSWINGHVTKTIGAPAEEPGKDMGRGAITADELKISKLIDIQQISAKEFDKMIIQDANGLVKSVPDYLQAVAVQRSLEIKDGKYAIRFLAPSYLEKNTISNVNMNVVATYKDANGVLQTKVFNTSDANAHDDTGATGTGCKLYDFLTVYSAHGVGENNVTAGSLGAKMIAGFTIYNIPVDATNMPEGVTFTATMTYTDAMGLSVTSRAMTVTVDAAGNIVK